MTWVRHVLHNRNDIMRQVRKGFFLEENEGRRFLNRIIGYWKDAESMRNEEYEQWYELGDLLDKVDAKLAKISDLQKRIDAENKDIDNAVGYVRGEGKPYSVTDSKLLPKQRHPLQEPKEIMKQVYKVLHNGYVNMKLGRNPSNRPKKDGPISYRDHSHSRRNPYNQDGSVDESVPTDNDPIPGSTTTYGLDDLPEGMKLTVSDGIPEHYIKYKRPQKDQNQGRNKNKGGRNNQNNNGNNHNNG